MRWTFAPNNGGQESGINDSGVHTFKGFFYQYLARELLQNSLDARHDPNKPVEVRFELLRLKRSAVPDIDSLAVAIERCIDYWSDQLETVKILKRAFNCARADEIQVLRAGDYNTWGVRGGDHDRGKDFYNLIRCAGSSAKTSGQGGSFGIGKNAPFAASDLRTVLYSTLNADGEYIFQGVAKLATHEVPGTGKVQATGYLGGALGVSVRSVSDIPKDLARSVQGTDIIVPGYAAGNDWQGPLVHSVLDSFWPAIEWGDLVVQFGKTKIDKAALPALLASYSGEKGFTAHHYHRAFREAAPVVKSLPHLGECSVYLIPGEHELPKKVAMIRQNGMVIQPRIYRSSVNYCGVFICRDPKGNELLRKMEPPKHNEWDPDLPDPGASRKYNEEFGDFIRDCIKKLNPVDLSKTLSVPGLNRFLPDDEETPEPAPGSESPEKDEGVQPTVVSVKSREISPQKQRLQPDDTGLGDEDSETEEEEHSEKQASHKNQGRGTGNGSQKSSRNTETKGGKKGGGPKPALPVKTRAYLTNPGANVWTAVLTLQTPASKPCMIQVLAIGDESKAAADVSRAKDKHGTDLPIAEIGLLGPVQIPAPGPLILELKLAGITRAPLDFSVYEA